MGYTFMVLKDVIKDIDLDKAEELFRTGALREPLRIGERFTYEGKEYKVVTTKYDFRYEHFCEEVAMKSTKIYAMELQC